MRGRFLIAVAAAALAFPAAGHANGGFGDVTFGYGKYPLETRTFSSCKRFEAALPFYRSCLADQAYLLVTHSKSSADELPRIDGYVHSVGGWLEANCHVLMHTVGRRYGVREHVRLTNLLDYLPKTNDPGCSAGFAHGLLIALGPQIQKLGPKGAAADCHRAATRYQRYSCIHGLGHAYARQYNDFIDPALASCGHLAPVDAPDCAQGVFHDYWIAIAGLDGTRRPAGTVTSPRKLCGAQPARYVRACWYRALLERPPAKVPASAADLLAICHGLAPAQHAGCLIGASLIRSSDPQEQLQTCARLHGDDAAACIRGVRVPAYATAPFAFKLRLIRGCANVESAAQRSCYDWLGKALNVVTNGTFANRLHETSLRSRTRDVHTRRALLRGRTRDLQLAGSANERGMPLGLPRLTCGDTRRIGLQYQRLGRRVREEPHQVLRTEAPVAVRGRRSDDAIERLGLPQEPQRVGERPALLDASVDRHPCAERSPLDRLEQRHRDLHLLPKRRLRVVLARDDHEIRGDERRLVRMGDPDRRVEHRLVEPPGERHENAPAAPRRESAREATRADGEHDDCHGERTRHHEQDDLAMRHSASSFRSARFAITRTSTPGNDRTSAETSEPRMISRRRDSSGVPSST